MSFVTCVVKPAAYVSLPLFALHTLSKSSAIARYYVRIALFLSTLSVCSVWGILAALGLSVVGRRLDTSWVVARSFYYLCNRAVGIRFIVEGGEHLETRPAVLVGNHQSMLDILYIGRIFPRRASIMAKKSLQWVPLLGQFMTLSGAVFIDRGNNAKAVRSLTAAGEIIHARHSSLWVFPEGTRSMREYHDMLPLKKGAFHTAVQAGVPIIPVVCENYWRLYHKGVFESGTLKVRVLPPISTEGLTAADVSALAVHVRELMIVALREISVPAASDKKAEPSSASEPSLATAPSEESEPHHVEPTELSVISSHPVEPTDHPEPESQSQSHSRAESRAESYASEETSASLVGSRVDGSETGTETEEDDGMVLVGHPSSGST
ncbi:hypothetical protein BKA93DRAFT_814664 [Sparassis latifolia]